MVRMRALMCLGALGVLAVGCATAATNTTVTDGGHGGDGSADGGETDASSDTSGSFTIGGTVTGLTGPGLVLQNNGGDDLTVNAAGSFAFATALTNGSAYAVTVKTQPTGQACTVTNGSGQVAGANITNVAIACATDAFSVGGTVSGLPTGQTLVLQDNGGDDLTIHDSGPFTFATKVSSGKPYAVTVLTQPASGTCTVQNGSGTVSNADVTGVTVVCSGSVTFAYTGAMQDFTVPGGITEVTLEAWGAQGNLSAMSRAGGLGGYATGKLAVTPTQVLHAFVGSGNTVATAGGFNGGGNAATHPCTTAAGGGGGGASDVRTGGATLADRVIVGAGGGGGAGDRVSGCGRGGGGGGGGGYYGGGGGAGWPSTSTTVPSGGTQSAGGIGGTSTFSSTNNGQAGVLGVGGAGGPEVSSNQAGSNTAAAGGNGGGATGSDGVYSGNYTGQSGAGGSSYIGGLTSASTTAGSRSGAGQVTISW